MNDIDKYSVSINSNIRNAIKKMDIGGIGFIMVIDETQNAYGIVTDGDFRRAVLKGTSLDKNVMEIANRNFKYVSDSCNTDEIKKIFKETKIQHLPVINNGKLVNLILKNEFLNDSSSYVNFKNIDSTVVIMAGGKGTRLEPFTNILPKPLIPIGNKTILELIMDEYVKFGIKTFQLTVNYKANIIKAYLEDKQDIYSIGFVDEPIPLGTAGSLKYLEGIIDKPFFVANCDIIIRDDYSKIYDFHLNGGYALTIVGSMQHLVFPYGVCEIEKGGELIKINEKPSFDMLVNTGMYILNPSVLEFIPKDTFFHITHLIEKLKSNNISVGVYPVSEGAWIDIGQWEEYKKYLNILK